MGGHGLALVNLTHIRTLTTAVLPLSKPGPAILRFQLRTAGVRGKC